MSSVTSQIAQIGRRINYFSVIADCSGYTVGVDTANYNSWAAPSAAINYGTTAVLQDMGEIAKYKGQILRKVRAVDLTEAGGKATAYFIVMPGGEYPVQGASATTLGSPLSILPIAKVARLG